MNAIKEAHYNLGIAYLEAGQYIRAIPEFEAAIKLDAHFIEAHCALCRAYLEQNELEKAVTAVTTALNLDTTHQPALLLHGTIIEAYHDQGKAYLDDKRYTEAVTAFQKAITFHADLEDSSHISPLENTHIYAHLGAAYIGMKAYQDAIDALENAISLDPDLVDAHYHLGHAYVEQGLPDKAIPHLERAIAISPNFKRAHYYLARANWESGNLESATHAVTETLRLDPNYQPARELADTIKQTHYNKGISYLNDEHYNEAATAFQNVIILDPNFITAHYNLGLTYLKIERYARAVDALQKTVTLDSTSKTAYHALAVAYFGQQKLKKAREAARDALKLDANYRPARHFLEAIDPTFTPSETQTPEPPESDPSAESQSSAKTRQQTHYELGIVYCDEKMYPEAIAEFKKAIDADSDFVAAYTSLGEVYLETEQLDEAENAANAALRIDENSEPARQLLDAIKQARPAPPSPKPSKPTETALVPTNRNRDVERGMVFLNNKQYNQAAAVFRKVINADLNSVEAHYGLGQAYLGIEAFDDAQAAADEALKRNPKHQPTHELIRLIKFARNREKKGDTWKKVLAYVVIIGIVGVGAIFVIYPDIIPWPNRNLDLSIAEITLVEDSSRKKNGFLDAGETAHLNFLIHNNSNEASNIEIRIQPSFIDKVNLEYPTKINKIPKNRNMNISIRMTADQDVKAKEVDLHIQLLGKIGLFGEKESLATKDFSFKTIPILKPVPPDPPGRE